MKPKFKYRWHVGDRRGGWGAGRAWPCVKREDAAQTIIGYIGCRDAYTPKIAKAGTHEPLIVYARTGVPLEHRAKKGRFVWCSIKHRPQTLVEAKALFARFVMNHPEHDWGIDEESEGETK